MRTILNMWLRSMSEDVCAPELRAFDASERGRVRRGRSTAREFPLPRLCFYRDLYRAV